MSAAAQHHDERAQRKAVDSAQATESSFSASVSSLCRLRVADIEGIWISAI